MNNKTLANIMLVVIGVGILILFLNQIRQPATNPDEFIIGAVLPMTGDAGTFGENASKGAELAIAEATANNVLQGKKIVLKIEDSRGTSADAAAAANKLIDIDGAQVLIGDVTSSGTHAIVPIISREKIPTISPSASDPELSGSSPFFARVWPSDIYEAKVLGDHVLEQGYSKIALVYSNTDYGVGMIDSFRSVVPQEIIALNLSVDRGLLDFRPTLTRILLNEIDALLVVQYPEDAKRFLDQMNELNISIPVLASATFEDPLIAESAKNLNIIFASPMPPDDDESIRSKFITDYFIRFGSQPGTLSDTGFDAAMLLITAWAQAGSEDPEAVIQYIKQLDNYKGVSGNMTFDSRGDVQKPYGLKTVEAGEFIWLEH